MPHDPVLPVAVMNKGEYEQPLNALYSGHQKRQTLKIRNSKTTTAVVRHEAASEAL